ncbi:uncharacterized protein LOC111602006 [Drosophila hydei]|uniref:Uncharacterized protein LOC111602006 n=1 Tax=Drosophila hydei TaxID=7224 RepID=A0A6J1M1G8_DROHY|nr:uncharacterized protein LOC111602006 [Drosophila hydei]
MKALCKFLSLDIGSKLADFFDISCEADATTGPGSSSRYSVNPVECLSYTIRHKYPKRLVTYDAEARCEPRNIRSSDITTPADTIRPDCQKRKKPSRQIDTDAELLSKCCEPFNLKEKYTKKHLRQLELRAKALYQLADQKQSNCAENTAKPSWECLSPSQKLRFHWKALTGHELRSTPYANFREIFITRYLKEGSQINVRQLSTVVRRTWLNLKSDQRLPFNLHALLYHVCSGTLDPFDHCAVRVLLNRWR